MGDSFNVQSLSENRANNAGCKRLHSIPTHSFKQQLRSPTCRCKQQIRGCDQHNRWQTVWHQSMVRADWYKRRSHNAKLHAKARRKIAVRA